MPDNNHTKRNTCPYLEEALFKPFSVLDHGFIRVIDYMGDDSSIVQAARVSYGKGTKQVNQDKGLINYLMRNKHTTPFEMCEIKFHIKLPIFVARQWIRHRTASVNEYSARYSVLGKEFYIPEIQNLNPQSTSNKQGREQKYCYSAQKFLDILKEDASKCYEDYLLILNEDENGNIIDQNTEGIARELARMNLTLNYYTEWYWKNNLHNLLHFLKLRADLHAQYEIREYARIILEEIVKKWVPHTYDAFIEYVLESYNLSKTSLAIVKRIIKSEKIDHQSSNLSKREWDELKQTLEF